tara:strand:+ start:1495 stop:2982 length:1488 start_codon:yes stop_codon:yes gene_type:complete
MADFVIHNNERIPIPDGAEDQEILDFLETIPEKNIYNAPLQTLERSGVQLGKDMIAPFMHPIETAKSIWELGKSVSNLLFVEGEQENEELARAAGDFFKERYGGIENIKKTFRTDPFGFVADLSLLVSGGAMLPARIPGVAGKISKAAGKAGRAIDPVVATTKGVKYLAMKPLGYALSGALGWTTGSGGKAVKTAYAAGYAGGDKAKAFSEGRAGSVDRALKVQRNLANSLLDLKNKYRARWSNSDAGIRLKNVKFSAIDINKILKNIERKNKRDGRWINTKDKELFEKISAIKKNIWGSTKRRSGAGGDAYIDEINTLLRDNPNNPVLLELKSNVKSHINNQMPNYNKLTEGFENISKQEQALENITSSGDADKILNNIKETFNNNTPNLVKRNVISNVDKTKKLNLEEVAAGQQMSGILPTSKNLVTQAIKMYGFSKAPTLFSPQIVGRKAKSLGYAQNRVMPPVVDVLRGTRAAQQQKDDEILLNDTYFYNR